MNDKTNETTTTAEAQALALLAADYAPVAKAVGKAVGQLEKARGGLWGSILKALPIGIEHGHARDTLRDGLVAAFAEADIPQGSVRSYLGTMLNLYADVQAGSLTLEAAQSMPIVDARKRYAKKPSKAAPAPAPAPSAGADAGESDSDEAPAPAEQTERSRLLSRLNELVSPIDDAMLALVVSIIEDALTEQAPARTGTDG